MNTQKLNDEMFGARKNYSGLVLMIGLIIVVLVGLLIVTSARAAGNNPHIAYSPVGCVSYTHGMVISSHGYTLTHANCGQGEQAKENKPQKSVTVATDDTKVTIDTPITPEPVTSTPVVKGDKPKCNNGEGNGGEGCSPANSDHANNDENNTTPREDKSH